MVRIVMGVAVVVAVYIGLALLFTSWFSRRVETASQDYEDET